MTFIEKFEKLKKKFDKAKNPVFSEDFAIQVNMTDSDCSGAFYVACIDGVFSVEPYDYRDNTAMLTLESKVLEDLISGKATLDKALTDGDIDILGNTNHVSMLCNTIAAANKKPATKKSPVKKATKTDAKSEAKKAEPKKTTTKKTTKKTIAKKEENKQ